MSAAAGGGAATGRAAGLVFDDRYLQHDPGLQPLFGTGGALPFVEPTMHPSNHRLVMRAKQLIDLSGLGAALARIEAYPAGDDALAAYHDRAYLQRVRDVCAAGGGETGDGAPAGPGSDAVARLAAGGGMAAVDAVVTGDTRRVYALLRPPGHHAMRDKGMGFCIFNNAAVAARHAQRAHGLERVLVLDWDVHHGNGTQDAFWDDPSVLFVSLHQDDLYPRGWGGLDQVGAGPGAGFTVNVPLPAGSGDAAYLAALERVVLPIADAFRPELVLVSAGQDGSAMDPLGRMSLTTDGYRRLTAAVIDVAEHHAGGRLVALQEGGYSEVYAPYCTLAIVETLAGVRTGIPEPLDPADNATQPPSTTVGADAEAAIAAAGRRYAAFWAGVG